MVWYTFGPFSAYDPVQNGIAKSATFTVYDENDTTNSSPLPARNLGGLVTPPVSDADGMVVFQVEDHPAVKIVSGPYSIPAYSVKDMRDVTLAAQASAAESATQAANTASSVAALDSWVKLGVTRYNRCPNPHWIGMDGKSAAASGWTQSDQSDASSQGDFVSGKYTIFTVDVPTTTGTFIGTDVAARVPVTPGAMYTASACAQRTTSGSANIRTGIMWIDSAGATISQTFGGADAAAWKQRYVTAEAPVTAAYASVIVSLIDVNLSAGDTVRVAQRMLTEGTEQVPFFSGDTPNTDLKGYAWSGTPNASVSQMIDYTALRDEPMAAIEALDGEAVKSVNGVMPDANGNVQVQAGGGGGVTDHGNLAGLADDDHTQYHNNARGDARYYRKSEVDTMVNNAASAQSSADRNRANHTGSQPISSVTNLESRLASLEAGSGGSGISLPLALSNVQFSSVGAQVAGAANQASARTAIGAGTSSLALGGTAGAASTAMRSDAILVDPTSVPTTGTYFIFRRDVS